MAHPFSGENIEAHIQGEISGQVAVGNYNIQIGAIHGGVVNVVPPERQPRPRPRSTPILLRPRPFPGLLDREAEVSTATAALQSALPVEFHGQPGLGKTTLLRYLSHHPTGTSFPDGVIYFSARHQPLADLLQSFFDTFYESDVPFKPTDTQVRHALQGKQALILLDDVELARDEVETLMDTAPGCTFLLASPERRLWGEGRTVALHGLPLNDSLALVERELGRPLTPEERPAAQALCTALDGHPLHLIQATALARETGRSLMEVAVRLSAHDEARQVQSASPAKALMAQVLASLSEPEQHILAALATLSGASLSVEHLAALTGLADAEPVLETLLQRGLVQTESPRYSPTGTLGEHLQQVWDLSPLAKRALAYFTAWAEQHRSAPDRLLEDADAILQAMEWGVSAGHWAEVLRLGRAVEGALALGRRWGAWAQVLQWGLQAARALRDQAAEAWALHQLGTRALCLGDAATARTSLIKALHLRESLGDRIGAAVTRHNLDLLVGPPPPPRRSPQPPSTPSPTSAAVPVAPLLSKEMVVLLSALLLVLGGLMGVLYFWPTPPPPTITPTSTPTTTSTNTPTTMPTNTPTPTSTPDRESPPAPQLIAPEQRSQISCAPDKKEQQVRLQWATVSDPSGIQGYEVHLEAIERSPYTYPPQFLREPFVDILVPCTETYLWRVRATDNAGNAGAWSEERVFSVIDTTKPPAPKLLEPKDRAEIPCPTGQSASTTLRWSEVEDPSGIVGYLIQLEAVIRTTPIGPTPTPFYVGPVKGATLEVSLNCGWDYRWRMQAVDGVGNPGAWSEERLFSVIDKTSPPAITLLDPQNGTEISCPTEQSVSITLRWSPITDPSGIARYDVELVRTPNYPPVPITFTLQIEGSQSQTIISSGCGESYGWRVRAVDGAKNVGEWSRSWHFRVRTLQETDQTPPQPPTPLEPGSPYESEPAVLESCDQVVLRWTAASDNPNGSGVQDYRVNLQRYEDGAWKSIQPYFYIYDTSIYVAQWLSIGRHRWSVWARDKAGNQSDASVWLYFECADRIPPQIPTPLRPGKADSTGPEKDVKCPVTLIWDPVSDPSGVVYEVILERRDTVSEGWKQVNSWYPVSSSDLRISYPECTEKTEYRWRGRAQDGAENWSGWPQWLYYTTYPG